MQFASNIKICTIFQIKLSFAMTMSPPSPPPCSCCCCSTIDPDSSNPSLSPTQVPPFHVTTSEFSISLKEIIILGLVFLLFIYSIFSFLHNWKKNYRDISSSCQYSPLAHDNTSNLIAFIPTLTLSVKINYCKDSISTQLACFD